MKLMIASDIHGSAFYTDLLMKAFEKENPDKLLLLGDILYHGPRNDLPKDYAPKKVIPMLNGIKDKIICIRGNCDAEVDQMVLEFPILPEIEIFSEQGHLILGTHGHVYNEEHLPPLGKGDILLHGHTHVPKYIEYENYTLVNPGSVSIPKEDSPHSYLIYESGLFTFKDLEGGSFQPK